MPAGVGSVTVTLAAFDGPLFVTTMVKITFWPAVIRAGPVLVTPTSADGVTVVVACRVNDGCDPAPSGSMVAVFVTVPEALALTFTWNCTVAVWPALTWPAGAPGLFTDPPCANGIFPETSASVMPLSFVVPAT